MIPAPWARFRHRCRGLPFVAIAAAILPAHGTAQIVFTPVIGAYVPTGNLYQEPGTFGTARQGTSFAFGGRLTFSTSGKLGLEASATYAPSDVEFVTPLESVSRSSYVWLGSLRLIYVLNSQWAAVNVYLAGGPAVVTRGGEAYQGVSGLTEVGGNLALGALFRAGAGFRIRLEVEDYLYESQMTLPGGETTGALFQNDFVFSFGLSIPIG